LSVLAFAIAGIALMGVQPSGASLAKDLLLQAATETGQWWWAVVLQAGGMLTAAYVVLVLAHALAPSDKSIALTGPAPRLRDIAALVLALCSLLLGLMPWEPLLPGPYDSTSSLFDPGTLFKSLLPVLGGVVLAILLSPWPHPLASSARWKVATRVLDLFRRSCFAFAGLVERGNSVLCQWPAAGISLLLLALLFGASMLVAA
jgi:NADH:ubiquinone oxidoreductase subunit 5 (subunit L)/multisubunit Na+/H+ antiporter MnhA subunit